MLVFFEFQIEKIVKFCREQYPIEACGLLGGKIENGVKIVESVYFARNIAQSESRFDIEAKEQYEIIKKMRAKNEVLLGNFHSHPKTPARPSAEDRELMLDPNLVYVIFSLKDNPPTFKGFKVSRGEVSEEEITVKKVDYKTLKSGGIMRQTEDGYFAVRLKITGGNLSIGQLKGLEEVASRYGNGTLHLTARQGVEIPYIHIADLEEVIEKLKSYGLELGACGPRVRTVTACQGRSICPNGCIETQELAREIAARYYGQTLPHKFKFGITGCANNCLKAEENDLGIKGVCRPLWLKDNCTACGLCTKICPVNAITLNQQEISVDYEVCIGCGDCVKACPFEAYKGEYGYSLSFGGSFGRKINIGKKLIPFISSKEKMFTIFDKTLEFYRKEGKTGERFYKTLERVGFAKLEQYLREGERENGGN